MAEIATIARPYAEALHQLSSANAQATLAWLDELAHVAVQPELLQFAANPKITAGQVYDLIAGVVQNTLDSHGQNFLRLLIENRRLVCLPEIAAQFRVLVNARSGTSEAVVFSAFPIDATNLAATTRVLEQKFKRRLNVSVQLQPELIGGIRVVVGDEVFDTSIKTRLEQMKVALLA